MCCHGVQLWLCTICIDAEILELLSPEGPELVSDYYARVAGKCECGSAKLGIKPYEPGHSDWCPVCP